MKNTNGDFGKLHLGTLDVNLELGWIRQVLHCILHNVIRGVDDSADDETAPNETAQRVPNLFAVIGNFHVIRHKLR